MKGKYTRKKSQSIIYPLTWSLKIRGWAGNWAFHVQRISKYFKLSPVIYDLTRLMIFLLPLPGKSVIYYKKPHLNYCRIFPNPLWDGVVIENGPSRTRGAVSADHTARAVQTCPFCSRRGSGFPYRQGSPSVSTKVGKRFFLEEIPWVDSEDRWWKLWPQQVACPGRQRQRGRDTAIPGRASCTRGSSTYMGNSPQWP